MFEVLAYVYEAHDSGDAWPQTDQLEQKLRGVGFESDEIGDALDWLQGLDAATGSAQLEPWLMQPRAGSVRIYPRHEQLRLGSHGMGFIHFLEAAGVLPAALREVVIDRAMAAPGPVVSLDALKIIILLAFWRFGREPDALVLDVLCDSGQKRLAH